MAKRKPATKQPRPSVIYEASLGTDGAVVKGALISEPDAESRRRAGMDVVVCNGDLATNRRLAQKIEVSANGKAKRCPPHATAGLNALPHYQPDARPPSGHTFYETDNRKAR